MVIIFNQEKQIRVLNYAKRGRKARRFMALGQTGLKRKYLTNNENIWNKWGGFSVKYDEAKQVDWCEQRE